jgi:ppGpp synthetase/RelA/SpoT-type nucleotidyltranferase
MDIVEQFLARYRKEYDFYDQAARLAAQKLESGLQAAGIRSMVTSRAKSPLRLEDKVRQRMPEKRYQTVEDIFVDIVDLAGCRVALYFPGDREQVRNLVKNLFQLAEPAKEFPTKATPSYEKRFSGYWATHYRVQLYEPDLNDTQKRYAQARIEIQVASVLMHGWSEVEHDLVYKPFQGHLSVEEYAILDELNGLVMAGEIALERLQKAGEARVSDSGRPFTDHFDLAVHLLDRASSILGGSFGDSALGRVDLLFDFLAKVNLCTPQQIATYISALHDDTEKRPIAEQIVDQILAEDQSRYGAWESVRASRQGSSQQFSDAHAPSRGVTHEEMGRFLAAWIAFERANQERAAKSISPSSSQIKYLPIMRLVESSGVYEASEISEIDRIRRLRNALVHGASSIDSRDLNEASHLLSLLKGKLPVNKAKAIKRTPRQSKRTNPRKS